ncbi:hypothetical protein VCHA53O466_50286 [Vibrio chagasii]|nr:hypothetical protein VCHA53O466_50286 [Vibrio chagasii]
MQTDKLESLLDNLKSIGHTVYSKNSTLSKEAFDASVELLNNYIAELQSSKNIVDSKKLLNQVPSAISLFELGDLSVESNLNRARALLLATLSHSYDFLRQAKMGTVLSVITNQLDNQWCAQINGLFTNETIKFLLDKPVNPQALTAFLSHFINNSNDRQSLFVDIHSLYTDSDDICTLPELMLSLYNDCTDSEYEQVKHLYLSDRVKYSTSESHLPDSAWNLHFIDHFANTDDIEAFITTLLKSGRNTVSALNTLHPKVAPETLEVCVGDIFKNGTLGSFKRLNQEVRDLMAEDAIATHAWSYKLLSSSKKKEFGHLIDFFGEHISLLGHHPEPETIATERWVKCIQGETLSYKLIPEHLVYGKESLSIEKWVELISSIKGGRNKLFSQLAATYPSLTDGDELIKAVVASPSAVQAHQHPIVQKYLKTEERNNKTIAALNEAKDSICSSSSAICVSKAITRMLSKGANEQQHIEELLLRWKCD